MDRRGSPYPSSVATGDPLTCFLAPPATLLTYFGRRLVAAGLAFIFFPLHSLAAVARRILCFSSPHRCCLFLPLHPSLLCDSFIRVSRGRRTVGNRSGDALSPPRIPRSMGQTDP
ncbi:hypothetical protein MTO96_021397 [Rhipicephalus appendiculatus]